jgi:twitching motility protein PilJ
MSSKKAGTKKNQPAATATAVVATTGVSTAVKFAFVLTSCIVLTLLVFFWVYQNNSHQRDTLNQLAELRLLSQQIAVNTQAALKGDAEGFNSLQQAQTQFQNLWQSFRSSQSAPALDSIHTTWSSLADKTQQLNGKMQSVVALRKQAPSVQSSVLKIKKNYQDLVSAMPLSAAMSKVINERQLLLADHLLFALDNVLNGQSSLLKDGEFLTQDLQSMDRVLRDQLQSDDQAASQVLLNENYQLVHALQARLTELTPLMNDTIKAKQIAQDIPGLTDALLKGLTELEQQGAGGSGLLLLLGFVLAAASVAVLILMLSQSNRQTKSLLEAEASVRVAEEQANQRNQKAILRLLDELGDLADGDLTVETTVTEDFTGAIADSINFTIDQLRSLVSTINQTAVQVSSAAEETQNTAKALAEASDHQAQEIAGASAAINEMALSIDQVSANAYESSAVAERSVSIAKKGADVVQATIRGMDTIREQIQDTSKRIKRLGESSQEIGDIVSLINDIADQTNILALNAAIQASMAGDAGRGFAVVADEVQRLAERASAATKQIEALVKTIQNDTHEAVISMEQTTTQVVNGANLAQDAGVALEEIENVSSNLANLIQNISNAARQQASSAGQISNTMNVIQEITSQTSAGTSVTASSIGHLADLAVQMRTSVSGFKLPDQKRLI